MIPSQVPIPCSVAVVGAGVMAREHIRAFAAVPGTIIKGICSRTRERAERIASEFGITSVCDSVYELYERTRADLVVVCVNELSMESVSRQCFELPWTVLLEKPAGYNLETSQRILKAAKDRRTNTFVALNRRNMFTTRTALAELAGDDGPRFISVHDQEDLAAAIEYGQPPEVVANWMFANSIHLIDYLRVFGRGEVRAVSHIVPWEPHKPFLVMSKIEFESGDVGVYQGVWNAPGPWAVTITTPRRRWEMRPLERIGYQNRGERKVHEIDVPTWDLDFKPGLRLQAELACKAAIGLPSDLPTLEEAFKTMQLIASIFQLDSLDEPRQLSQSLLAAGTDYRRQ